MQQVRVYQSVLTKPQLAKCFTLRQRAANKAGRDTNLCFPPTRLRSISRPTAGAGDAAPGLRRRTQRPEQFRLRTPLGKAPGQDWPFSLLFQAPRFGWCFPQLAPMLETAPGRRNFCPSQRKGSVLAGVGLPDPGGSLPTQHILGFCGNWSGWNRNIEFLVAHPPGQGRREPVHSDRGH